MATIRTTLREFLTQRKPPISHASESSTQSTAKGEDIPFISTWNDFSLDSINKDYDEVLKSNIDSLLGREDYPGEIPVVEKHNFGKAIFRSIDMIRLVKWNNELMKPALSVGKCSINFNHGVPLDLEYHDGQHELSIQTLEKGVMKKRAASHIIKLDDEFGTKLVVGLSVSYRGWTASALDLNVKKQSDPKKRKRSLVGPLHHLRDICKGANTRYGYIQSHRDILICRFNLADKKWSASVKVVPWAVFGNEVLTTDLAIWGLCMLAMSKPEKRVFVDDSSLSGHQSLASLDDLTAFYHLLYCGGLDCVDPVCPISNEHLLFDDNTTQFPEIDEGYCTG